MMITRYAGLLVLCVHVCGLAQGQETRHPESPAGMQDTLHVRAAPVGLAVYGIDPEMLRRIVAEEWAAYWRDRGERPSGLDARRLEAVLQRLLATRLPAAATPRPRPPAATPPARRPIIVLPGQAPATLTPTTEGRVPEIPPTTAETPTQGPVVLQAPTPPVLQPLPAAISVHTVEVERALRETGLFRAIQVLFEFDQAILNAFSRPTLDAVGDILARHPTLRIAVHGHTDGVGSPAYNLDLSERRAEAVRAYLLDAFPSIETEHIETKGFGMSRPLATNATPVGRAMNRRVEFVVIEQPTPSPWLPEPRPEALEPVETLDEMLQRLIREELERAGRG